MGSINNCELFSVVVKKKEVVAAVLPVVQEYWLPMSNLDLLLPPLDVGVFFCYNKVEKRLLNINNHHKDKSTVVVLVQIIKKALAQALVSFYAFAGEVVENRLGEPELLCNNRGVDFIQAYADIELRELDLHHPDSSVQGKLVPFKNQGVLAIQVTELKCGGLVIGCTFDHRVADAHSANMFFVSWANISQNYQSSKPPQGLQLQSRHHFHQLPCFRRSLISPRRPPHYDPSIDSTYVLLSTLPPPEDEEAAENDILLSRIYYISKEDINRLQSQSSANGCKPRSKLVSFSAFLWKIIATGGDEPTKKCKLGIVVDGRDRLGMSSSTSGGGDTLQRYFGNVLSVPYGEESVGELKAMELSQVAEAVNTCLVGATKDEKHFQGLIDWVELHRPEKAIVRVYCKLGDEDEAAVVVSSGQRFPVSKIDFGWGPPAFGSYHFPWGGQTGYVMPMPSTSRDGDWVVYMHLLKKHLDLVESQAGHMFRPLTPTYLKFKP